MPLEILRMGNFHFQMIMISGLDFKEMWDSMSMIFLQRNLCARNQSCLNEGTAGPARLLYPSTADVSQGRDCSGQSKFRNCFIKYQIGTFQLYCPNPCISGAVGSGPPVTTAVIYKHPSKLKSQSPGNPKFVPPSPQGTFPERV